MKTTTVAGCLLLLLLSAPKMDGAKILVLYPPPSFSHYTLGVVLAEELARRGHNVTFVSAFPNKIPVPNCRQLAVSNVVEAMEKRKKSLFDVEDLPLHRKLLRFFEMTADLTKRTLESDEMQQLLKSNEHFDLVLVEYFLNEAHFGLANHFKAPLVIGGPTGASFVDHLLGNPAPSSYVPNMMSSFTKHMNFWQRLQNLAMNTVFELVRQIFILPKQREIFKEFFKSGLELDDVLYNASLLLTNSHVSVSDAVPHLPNIIEIGGYHVRSPTKLPEEIQKFLDDSKEGVVLFSMGSNLKSANLKPDTRTHLLKALGKIKQKVLWKFEEELPGLPKNVKIMQWLPQNDILAHPNIRAFISHGGMLSTMESTYHGVPVIGIPVFGDQKKNIATAITNGYALSVPLQELTEEKLSKALDQILNDPKYAQEAKHRSRVMQDQPLKPLDAAMFWIEYVIRHNGAPQLRSAAIDLKWYQRNMIDVLSFLTLIVITVFVAFYIIIKKVLGLILGKKAKSVPKSKKNR